MAICPHCGADHAPGARFCPQSGRPLPPLAPAGRFCSHCGAGLALEARFCRACGTAVAVASGLGQQPQAEQPGPPVGAEARAPAPVTTAAVSAAARLNLRSAAGRGLMIGAIVAAVLIGVPLAIALMGAAGMLPWGGGGASGDVSSDTITYLLVGYLTCVAMAAIGGALLGATLALARR